MAEAKTENPIEVSAFRQPASRSLGPSEIIAIALSAIWLLACVVFFLVMGGAEPDAPDTLRFVMVLITVALPVAVIWLAASAARSSRVMREESAQLQIAMNSMRQSFVEAQHAHVMGPRPADLTRKLEQIVEKQVQTEQTLATFVSSRSRSTPKLVAPPPETAVNEEDSAEQPSLELGTPEGALVQLVEVDDLIRAINFPENGDDQEGFAALRRALGDRKVASLIQAAQDVLTLLSQDGIYMDDLRPDRARPEVWRQFALGERGRAIADLGGIRDRSSLALTAGRMRQDPVFRDAAHHFLRRFDEMLSDVEPRLSDEDMTRLGNTRTARAFMLLGRVTHTFE